MNAIVCPGVFDVSVEQRPVLIIKDDTDACVRSFERMEARKVVFKLGLKLRGLWRGRKGDRARA